MSELELLKAKRAVVENLLCLPEAQRNHWLSVKEQLFQMYQSYSTQELKDKEKQLSAEILQLQGNLRF